MPTNLDRARWGKKALEFFKYQAVKEHGPLDEDCASDLIVDLLHYARQQGWDTEEIMGRAARSYSHEATLTWEEEDE